MSENMKAKTAARPGKSTRSRRRAELLKPERIDNPTVITLAGKLAEGSFEKVVLCEGDSWFDIFTPFPLHEPNLLGALRTPRRTLLVDISHIGDTAREMATDPQAANTLALMNEFKFDALLLSAGGNDLKNAFKETFLKAIVHAKAKSPLPKDIGVMTSQPAKADSLFEEVVGYIATWIGLRRTSKLNRDTPVVLHGYDYLQPRPAPARATLNGLPVSGPWLHPVLHAAGQSDEQMLQIAKEVIDTLNAWLIRVVKPLPNVHLLETRNKLTLAEPKSKKASNDWMDEIHATPEGYAKLAEKVWNPVLARLLG